MGISWGRYGKYLIGQAQKDKIPLFGQFELTSRCNLRCRMCYVSSEIDKNILSQELSASEWIRLAKEARDAGMLYLLLTGGEVFVRKDFKEIYEGLSELGLVIQINTNATRITPEIAKWLGKIPPSSVAVTIYGASPDTYSKICGDANGYEQALRGIELLHAEGIRLKIRTTVVRGNSKEFSKLTKITDQYGLTLSLVDYVHPTCNAKEECFEAKRLSPQELIDYEEDTLNYYYDKDKEVLKKRLKEDMEDELPDIISEGNDQQPFRCISGKCRFCITWDGKMVPCVMMNTPFATPSNMGFQGAWNKLQELCLQIPICTKCMKCDFQDYCMSCPASRMNETGFYDKPIPYLCELMNYRFG